MPKKSLPAVLQGFKINENTRFKYVESYEFEFSTNPILQFDSADLLLNFLKKEQELSALYQDLGYAAEIEALMHENENRLSLDNFYVKYTVEIKDDEILIFFTTNSLIFKYAMLS